MDKVSCTPVVFIRDFNGNAGDDTINAWIDSRMNPKLNIYSSYVALACDPRLVSRSTVERIISYCDDRNHCCTFKHLKDKGLLSDRELVDQYIFGVSSLLSVISTYKHITDEEHVSSILLRLENIVNGVESSNDGFVRSKDISRGRLQYYDCGNRYIYLDHVFSEIIRRGFFSHIGRMLSLLSNDVNGKNYLLSEFVACGPLAEARKYIRTTRSRYARKNFALRTDLEEEDFEYLLKSTSKSILKNLAENGCFDLSKLDSVSNSLNSSKRYFYEKLVDYMIEKI